MRKQEILQKIDNNDLLNSRQQNIPKRILEIKEYIDKEITIAKSIENKIFKSIALFSILDSFCQEYSNYSKVPEKEKFKNFVMKYQKSYQFLNEIDPVTLYYDVEDYLPDNCQIDFLYPCSMPTVNSVINHESINKMKIELEKNIKFNKNIDTILRNHKFIYLLYRMRSKLVHELTQEQLASDNDDLYFDMPFYQDTLRFYINNSNQMIQETCWNLRIPITFIENLTRECITNYLDECLQENKEPFFNNTFERKFRLSWYD